MHSIRTAVFPSDGVRFERISHDPIRSASARARPHIDSFARRPSHSRNPGDGTRQPGPANAADAALGRRPTLRRGAGATPTRPPSTDTSQAGDEIVVTAQFRAQNLQDTPLAITAVNAAMMEAKSQTNLAQVADSAPNVTLKPQGASFGPSVAVSIRGIGQDDFNPAYEPGVGIYIDDVYYPQLTGAVFDLLDLDRVEILRGPQGTLVGPQLRWRLDQDVHQEADRLGRRLRRSAPTAAATASACAAGVDFKLTDDLFARISGVFKHQDGYVNQFDFGCVYPAGGTATFTANDGSTQLVNPAGGIPRGQADGSCSSISWARSATRRCAARCATTRRTPSISTSPANTSTTSTAPPAKCSPRPT